MKGAPRKRGGIWTLLPEPSACYGFFTCDVSTGRKPAGAAERRFRLSHFTIDQGLISRAAWRRVRARSASMNRLVKILFALTIVCGFASPPASAEESLTVFAAASMKNALDEVDAAYTARTTIKVTASYAASSALAKQIDQGAPADIFLPADIDWMDYATKQKTIKTDTRTNLLGNSIVLVAPKDSSIDKVTIASGFDLAKLAGNGRIATGDVNSVPVGKYAKAALQKRGAWDAAAPKLAMAESVRAALTLVARGEAVLGIVYATDARVEPQVKIVGTFPADSHPAIIYPVAATNAAGPGATDYLAFLHSQAAKTIFEKYGFTFLTNTS